MNYTQHRKRNKRPLSQLPLSELILLESYRTGCSFECIYEAAHLVIKHGMTIAEMRWRLMKHISQWMRT